MKEESVKFNDAALNAIASQNAARFSNFQESLDKLSGDIKRLEAWLQACGVCLHTTIPVGRDEYLSWTTLRKEWRLVFQTRDNDDPSGDSMIFTPLIETPVRTRLQCGPFLSKLVNSIAAMLPPEPKMVQKSKSKAVDDLDSVFSKEDEIPF